MKLNFLLAETFRVGKQYQLLEAGQIHQSEQYALADVLNDEDVFGIFTPTLFNHAATHKIAYKDIALLYYALQAESKLPLFIQRNYDDDINRTIARLVMDGILEIKWNEKFVSGSEAQVALYEIPVSTTISSSHIIAISRKAIQYGLQLYDIDTRSLATKLYCYNMMPVQENYFSTLTDSYAIEKFLGVSKKNILGWTKQSPSDKFHWLSWFRSTDESNSYEENNTYKIYISPTLETMPDAFASFLDVISTTKAFSFKVGANRQGLLRPDKWVVYFRSYKDLLAAAQQLQLALAKYPVQGVPFTAPLDTHGLLSWGIDPPRNEVLEDREGGSWRASVTDKIAIAIGQAKTEKIAHNKAIDFVMNKLFLDNIDASTWTPIENNLH